MKLQYNLLAFIASLLRVTDEDSLSEIEQVNSDCPDSDEDPLALALRSLRFLSASQILFA